MTTELTSVRTFFLEDSASIPLKRLSENAYGDALQRFINVCVDVVLFNKVTKSVYLAHRRHKPLADWWLIGGSRMPCEEASGAIQRALLRETTLDISRERFFYLDQVEYIFDEREQSPQHIGCHSLSDTFALAVDTDELEVVRTNLDKEEYDADMGFREFSISDLDHAGLHPAILHFARLIQKI